MLIPPKYILTPEITNHLQTIEACKAVIDSFPLPLEIETNIRRKSILKSALFSARIEGNPLTLNDISEKPSTDQKKKEVYNILQATELIRAQGKKDLNVRFVMQLHRTIMKQLSSDAGKLRSEVSAIFNTTGIATYLPPPPKQVLPFLEKLVTFANSAKEPFVPIRAVLCHYIFEKVHPFLDGNGRVGRLLLQTVLGTGGYGMKGLLAIEEYLDTHRSLYYRSLEAPERDVTDYLEFMLEAIATTAVKAKEQVMQKQEVSVEDYLLPRRAEILGIIKDHRSVSFDFIRRRFLAVNERTLRYDLKKLQDAGLIRKRGITKGSYYEPL